MPLDSELFDPTERNNIDSHSILDRLEARRAHTFFHEPLATQGSRRFSLDVATYGPRTFLVHVESTLEYLLSREDTDHNFQITIDDFGPKNLSVATVSSQGFKHIDIRGTYMLSNLLQELTLAKSFGHKHLVLDEARLTENPVERLSRLIRDAFWKNLTRRLDGSSIDKAAKDPKDWTPDPHPRIYVPASCADQIRYYQQIAHAKPELTLDVQILRPSDCTPHGIRDLNAAPGILALAMESYSDESTGELKLRGLPFIVPGGRFNELYGWDSYMESIGLIIDHRVDLAEAMVKNFCFCIKNYGKILNANRTYYLGRSQPPFLTDMALRVYEKKRYETGGELALDFLQEAMFAAIKEYYTVWMCEPRLDLETGLSRYRPEGVGIPPETESTHFVHLVQPFADKHAMEYDEFVTAYNNELVSEPELDEYFLHDRAVRESGHDTSYRLEKVAANLATVDLNSLLYKYETDIARTIDVFFNGNLQLSPDWCTGSPLLKAEQQERADVWFRRAELRRHAIDRYLWNEEKGMYFDYDTVNKSATEYESATTFWALWAGLATPHQAEALVEKALPKLEAFGGIMSGTEDSRGAISLSRPSRQWDFPFGWAPHQILAWTGFLRYGYEDVAKRLAYKWLYTITKSFTDFNGMVVEKYDVTRPNDPHKVTAEYGNQGSDFKGVAREGFGWVNASYQLGLTIVDHHMRRALGVCTPWDTFEKARKG